MNLVVAYLTKVREHIIVPEHYIHGFNLKALKNYGNNSCRDQLIYWSDECSEGEYYPDPKVDARVSEKLPARSGAWYHARTIFFTDDIEEAKKIKEKRRRVCPGTYNEARLYEQPLPLLVLVSNDDEQQQLAESHAQSFDHDPLNDSSMNSDTIDAAMVNEEQQLNEPQELNTNNLDDATNMTQNNQSGLDTDEQFNEISSSQPNHDVTIAGPTNTTANNELIEVVIQEAQLDGVNEIEPNTLNETSANDNDKNNAQRNDMQEPCDDAQSIGQNSLNENISGDESDIGSQIPSNSVTDPSILTDTIEQSIKPEPVFEPLVEENARALDDVFNESYEACDTSGELLICSNDVLPMPMTMTNPYEVKQCDIISGNMAYAINNEGDRAYIVTQNTKWKQLCLSNRVIKGLKSFNVGFRNSIDYDKKFVKVLLVACVGIAKIQAGQLDPFAMEFIKDLFSIRTDNRRIGSFDDLIIECCEELSERFQ